MAILFLHSEFLLANKLSDRQEAIKAFDSSLINSKTVYDCCRYLNAMTNRCQVCITRVPRHRDIPDNCRADDLAKRGTTIELSDELDFDNSRWASSDKVRTLRKIWPRLERRLTVTLLQRSRLSTVISFITGHYTIGTHANHIGLEYLANDFCRICGDEDEDETILNYTMPPITCQLCLNSNEAGSVLLSGLVGGERGT